MEIYATEKLGKRVLNLSSVNLQLKAGQSYVVNDSNYYNTDIQSAIRIGYLGTRNHKIPESNGPAVKQLVKCKNISFKMINIPGVINNIMPGQEFSISEDILSRAEVKTAISKKKIKVLSIGNPSDGASVETTAKLSKLINMQSKNDQLTTNEEITISGKSNHIKAIDISDSSNQTEDTQKTEKKKTAKEKTVKDQKVVWNPSGKKIVNNKVIDSENPDKVAPDDVQRKNIIIVDPNNSLNNNSIVFKNNNNKELTFADQEAEKKRIASHPVLKDKTRKEDKGPLIE